MRNSVFQKRMPTLLGVFLVGVGILLSSWFLQTGVLFPTQAASGSTPQNVRISNVSDTSFTISYTTTEAVGGYVSYGENIADDNRKLDARDIQSGTPAKYNTHLINVDGLKPKTTYSYKIVSGDKDYMKDGSAFTFTTPGVLYVKNAGSVEVSGKVELSSSEPALVYVSLSGSQIISTLTNSSGDFDVAYKVLRSIDFSTAVTTDKTSVATILITNNEGSSRIQSSLESSNPLPMIRLSQNYDFTLGSSPVGAFDASDSANLAGFPSFEVTEPNKNLDASIITPNSNEGFSDQQPQFNGTASPNSEVEIIIHSDQKLTAKVKSNPKGNWSFRPTSPLVPGEHTITIRTRDSFGIIKEIQQSFVVYAEGSQFTDPSVSPIKTPIPSKKPTPTLTATPTRIPSVSPSQIATPTVVISSTIIPTPSPTLIVLAPSISPAQPPPVSGSPEIYIYGIVGIVTLSVGLLVLFMSREKFI